MTHPQLVMAPPSPSLVMAPPSHSLVMAPPGTIFVMAPPGPIFVMAPPGPFFVMVVRMPQLAQGEGENCMEKIQLKKLLHSFAEVLGELHWLPQGRCCAYMYIVCTNMSTRGAIWERVSCTLVSFPRWKGVDQRSSAHTTESTVRVV